MGIKDNKDKMRVELDWSFIEEMAQRMDANKDKYPRDNWKQPIDVVELEDALMRHWFEYKRGDDKENHLAAIALNAMMIWYQKNAFSLKSPQKDCKEPEEESEEKFKKFVEELKKSQDINNNKYPWTPSKYPWETIPYCSPDNESWKDKFKGGFLYSDNSNEYIGASGLEVKKDDSYDYYMNTCRDNADRLWNEKQGNEEYSKFIDGQLSLAKKLWENPKVRLNFRIENINNSLNDKK